MVWPNDLRLLGPELCCTSFIQCHCWLSVLTGPAYDACTQAPPDVAADAKHVSSPQQVQLSPVNLKGSEALLAREAEWDEVPNN